MSKTLRKEVLARLKEQYSQTKGSTEDARLNQFLDYTSVDRIRADTDTAKGRHESIMSRGAFENLAAEVSEVLKQNSLTSIAAKSLTSDITFEEFREYLLNDVKLNTGKNLKRVTDGFTYTGASRRGKETGLTIASENLDYSVGPQKPSDRDVLILRNIPIGNLVTYYSDFLALKLTGGINSAQAAADLKALFNAGHLTGAFNARLIRALGLRKNPSGSVVFDSRKQDAVLSVAEVELNKIMSLITDADYLSSNIVNDIDLFITTDKRLYKNKVALRLTTEVQFAGLNKEAGNLLTQVGHAVSDLTKSVKSGISESGQEAKVEKALTRLYTNLKKLAEEVRKKAEATKKLEGKLRKEAKAHLDKILANTDAIDKIIASPGSKAIPEHLGYLIEATLKGLKIQEEFSSAKVADSIIKNTRPKPSSTKLSLKKPSLKTKPTKLAPIRNTQGKFTSLASLQTLLNLALAQQIQKNMGTGTSKNVLNYRTGRLAESAQVTGMSQSREGMLTAYYTYMKYPYQTFEPGYAQGSPRTRDPKLLISKSIREILSTQVKNRLRAVLS